MSKKYLTGFFAFLWPAVCWAGVYEDYLKILHRRTYLEAFQVARSISEKIPHDYFWKFQEIEIKNTAQSLSREDYLSYIEKLYMEGVNCYLSNQWSEARQKWMQVKLLKDQQGLELNQFQWNELIKFDFSLTQLIPKEILFEYPRAVENAKLKSAVAIKKNKKSNEVFLAESHSLKKRKVSELFINAQTAYEDGDWETSLVWFERLLKLEPENELAKNRLLEIKEKLN